jgi:FkbM family methyltransferase
MSHAQDHSQVQQQAGPRLVDEFVIQLTPFDEREARRLVDARAETLRRLLRKLKPALNLSTALDAGCGVGLFSQTLQDCGLAPGGFDGRSRNVAEARARFPEIPFEQGDVETLEIRNLGIFDFVLCFGLLYHLENPLLALRNLRALTGKCMLVESMCLPGDRAGALLREEPQRDNQSLSDVALYPTETTLIKMLYRAGFHVVYRVNSLPDHDDFRETSTHERRRTMLLASHFPVDVAGLRLCLEPHDREDPWSKELPPPKGIVGRIRRFLALTPREQYFALAQHARRVLPFLKIPFRLPFGAWWLGEGSVLDYALAHTGYETAEISFVQHFLRPGMTVLDLGAHHGLYSLLAAKCVGLCGRVIAFEPSPRERLRLRRHLKLNSGTNVDVQPFALGPHAGTAELYLVQNGQDGCNSLRPPAVAEATTTVTVPVRKLDDELRRLGCRHVDFIKLDVEGAELGALYGATELLSSAARPAILAEVQDLRTEPWGYAAREIIRFLIRKEYRWFALDAEGNLIPTATDRQKYDGNLVALPAERVREFIVRLNEGIYRDREPDSATSLRWSVVTRGKNIPRWLYSLPRKLWWLGEEMRSAARTKGRDYLE